MLTDKKSTNLTSPTSDEIKEVLKRNLKEFAPSFEDDAFVFSLIDQVFKKRVVIDEIIEKAAPDRAMSIIDKLLHGHKRPTVLRYLDEPLIARSARITTPAVL